MSKNVHQHFYGDNIQEAGKEFFQPGNGQLVRYPRADGSGEHAYCHDADQGGQVDEAQSVFGQAGRIPAIGDEAESAGKGDGEADGGGGAHGATHIHIMPYKKGYGERAAPDAHKAGNRADEQPGPGHSGEARQLSACVRFFVEEHVCGHIEQKGDKKELQTAGGNTGGDKGTAIGSYQNAQGNIFEDLPVYAATLVMSPRAGNGGEHDACQRCSDSQMNADIGGDVLPLESENKHGHDHRPAADAQEAGQNAGESAKNTVEDKSCQHVEESFSCFIIRLS